MREFIRGNRSNRLCASNHGHVYSLFCFDQEAVPSLYTDSMNLVKQQGGLSQSNNEVPTN